MALFFFVKCFEIIYKKLKIMFFLHPQSVVKQKEYYRLFTSDFIHHDWMHLLINLFFLYVYGGYLEDYLNQLGGFGSLQFSLIYFSSCLIGSGMVTIIHRKDFGFSSGGASASIIGCIFSYVILQPKRIAFYLPGLGPINNLYFGMVCIVVLFAYQRRSGNSLINYEQHFFGAIGGVLTTFLIFPTLIR
jgi:membrane associated rhomboid family serine protease